jgi:hypothetical protein
MEDAGIFYVHLVYFTFIRNILLTFGIFSPFLYEKSGSPDFLINRIPFQDQKPRVRGVGATNKEPIHAGRPPAQRSTG